MRILTLVGDPNQINTWSSTPYFFLKAGRALGFLDKGLPLRPEELRFHRMIWNAQRLLRSGRSGGFQYSEFFLQHLFRQVQVPSGGAEIISHFPLLPPRPWPRDWKVTYYIDATLRQNFVDYGYAARIGWKHCEQALRRERENYQDAARIVCMSKWAAASLVTDYGFPPSAIHVIRPGANLDEAQIAPCPGPDDSAAKLKPLRLGFVGKDWQRKGLPFLLRTADILHERGIVVQVIVAGPPKSNLPRHPLIEPVGFIDKQHEMSRFVALLQSFHFGCLFSSVEASAMSTLECLRLGVPVLASRVGGIPDTVSDGLGFLFDPAGSPEVVVELLEHFVHNPPLYRALRGQVAVRAKEFSWRQTVRNFVDLWEGSDAFRYTTDVRS
jgi:glycosyltransferase involved in cell wall biosynthesis